MISLGNGSKLFFIVVLHEIELRIEVVQIIQCMVIV